MQIHIISLLYTPSATHSPLMSCMEKSSHKPSYDSRLAALHPLHLNTACQYRQGQSEHM